ncbi:uncharacterized protein F5891DRAFT_1136058 [Suillus fuscotomentosus]|uniref:Autophagy-related protein 29 n=1 Tax=Suillus fuscotomentosus TaxID=1912939 RepID=A0AAD4EIT1_9AGAM|nr:uncharacterized protein F5891DRAFT_1136058 [Suillus fuscotomentosus]KAG1906856.1 hypothetical protein F5891DRAFT_1136058 [Suillus fuscotomentosus]
MPQQPRIRVVVQLPYNRPDHPLPDPPHIEWNAEKANVLWEVIALSRTSDNGGTDWKGLAAHLEVPLPYLLYRAQARYEDDLRGLQGFHAGNQQNQPAPKSTEVTPVLPDRPPSIQIPAARINSLNSACRLSSSKLATPLGVRARLNSLTQHNSVQSPAKCKKASSSSTSTLQGTQIKRPLRLPSPFSSDESDSEDEQAAKEEEADRAAEEAETLSRKLESLQRMMTSEALGLVSSPLSNEKGKARDVIRGRAPVPIFRPGREGEDIASFKREERNRDHSASVSSASSPQNSIPSIPSPSPESQSPMTRHITTNKSSSPPTVSVRNARGQSHMRYGTLAGLSEQESSHGSSASSFSDISEASFSASALESALMSNVPAGAGSRLSAIARSRFVRGVRL